MPAHDFFHAIEPALVDRPLMGDLRQYRDQAHVADGDAKRNRFGGRGDMQAVCLAFVPWNGFQEPSHPDLAPWSAGDDLGNLLALVAVHWIVHQVILFLVHLPIPLI